MLTGDDMAALPHLVGTATEARGRAYAARGAVVAVERPSPTEVRGAVAGTAAAPYRVVVALVRTGSGRLVDIHSRCTCPVGARCKHVVALLLAASAAEGTRSPARTRPARRGDRRAAAWEVALAPLLGDDAPAGGRRRPGETDPSEVGLQVELVPERRRPGAAPRSGRRPVPELHPDVRLRPVIPGRSGAWTRSGVSWDNLAYRVARPWATTAAGRDRVSVLLELAAVARASTRASSTYGYGEPQVWLSEIGSRRLWDLLQQAGELGIPLVGTGRGAVAPVLHRAPVVPAVDLRRHASGLALAARLVAGDDVIEPGGLVLAGDPPHGAAWWSGDSPALQLAPLAPAAGSVWQGLLASGPVTVPAADEDRFTDGALGRLRRTLPVVSGDGSVDLPDLPAACLWLTVHHQPGPAVTLRWAVGAVDGSWRQPLGDTDGHPGDPGTAAWAPATATPVTAAWAPGTAAQGTAGQFAGSGAAAGGPDTVGGALAAATAVVAGSGIGELVERDLGGARLVPQARLTGMAAVRAVSEVVPTLAALPLVEVEEIGEAPEFRPAAEAPVVRLDGAPAADGDWFDLAVSVTVGGEPVPFAELFTALASGDSHLVLPSGTWFALDAPELRRLAEAIAEARQLSGDGGAGDRVRVHRAQVSLWEDLRSLAVPGAAAAAWTSSVRALAEGTGPRALPAPDGLRVTLRPYQQVGFEWLATRWEHGIGGVLADDMGLGKTVQAIALVCHARQADPGGDPWLVLAPTSVVGNWVAECRRFAPDLRVTAITQTASRRGTAFEVEVDKADVVVTSYTLQRLEHAHYDGQRWGGVLLDEAQFAKNPASQTAHRMRTLRSRCAFALTGTPMENNLLELWSLLAICTPGLFPRVDGFADRYRTPIERHGDAERLAELRRRIRPVMLRRTKEQVATELPPKQEQELVLDLDDRHRRAYDRHLHRERQKVLGLLQDVRRNRIAILRSLTVLRQASLDVSLVDPEVTGVPSTKLDALVPMVEELVADGHRAVVFSQFTRFLGLARRRLQAAGIEPCYLDGRTRRRDEVIDRFRSGGSPVFLISLKAGGFGLNLPEADYCILLDPWWNPATEAQAVDRVHRIGQKRPVIVYRLVAADTIEEKVMALKARKAALFASVMEAGGFEAGGLDADDIRDLVG